MRDEMKEIITKLSDFQATVNYYQFTDIFGEGMAEHLWSKYLKCESNLLQFLALLDSSNLERIERYLESNI